MGLFWRWDCFRDGFVFKMGLFSRSACFQDGFVFEMSFFLKWACFRGYFCKLYRRAYFRNDWSVNTIEYFINLFQYKICFYFNALLVGTLLHQSLVLIKWSSKLLTSKNYTDKVTSVNWAALPILCVCKGWHQGTVCKGVLIKIYTDKKNFGLANRMT